MDTDTGHDLPSSPTERPGWTLLSNHGLVLLCIAAEPTMRVRDIAGSVGITERAAQRIVGELITGGYLSRRREGRRNVYEVHQHAPLRHPAWGEREVRHLLVLARA
jgi:hypothetical protein